MTRALLSVFFLAACSANAPPAATTQGLNDDQACQAEWHPSQPLPAGPCNVEIRMDSIEVTNAQGVSEGAFEVSVVGTATPGGSATWPSGDPANLAKDTVRTIDALLGTIQVRRGRTVSVNACADVTEFDSGLNGKDDGGSACAALTVTCNADGLATATSRSANVGLCRGDQWSGGSCTSNINANARVTFSAKSTDADADGVANGDDWAPDPCDDENLGERGRGVFIYVYAPAHPDFDLLQRFKPSLRKATVGYDYIVLVRDVASYADLGLDPWVEKHANLVLDATVDNFFAGMREIEAHGYDMDVLLWTSGAPDTYDYNGLPDPAGGALIQATDGSIDELALLARTNPGVIGAHTVPIRMEYSNAAWHGALSDAWLTVGAQAAAGAAGVNFFVPDWEVFQDLWNAGENFMSAVTLSPTTSAQISVTSYVDHEAQTLLLTPTTPLPPGCTIGPPPYPYVSDGGPCASWYFEGAGSFDFLGTYDDSENGLQNMAASSSHVPLGGLPTKFGAIRY